MAPRRRFDEGSESDDSECSISSKWTVQSEPKDEYPVDNILAEKKDEENGEMLYLVKWAGYGKERCTWEPADNFSDTTMDQWVREKKAIELGFKTAFPVEKWERDQMKKAEDDRRRWQRRKTILKNRQDCDWAEPPKNHPAFQEDFDSDEEWSEPLVLSPPRHLSPGIGRKTSAARSRSRAQAAAKRDTQKNQVEEYADRRRGADIMANYATEPPAKRPRKPADENQQYKSASHRWNVEKKGRDGPVPRVEDIERLLARPGELHSLQQSDLTGIRSQTGPSPNETNEDAAPQGPLAPYASTIPLTCFYWHNALNCPSTREKCRFTHGECDRVADQEIHRQTLDEGTTGWKPKFWSPTRFLHEFVEGLPVAEAPRRLTFQPAISTSNILPYMSHGSFNQASQVLPPGSSIQNENFAAPKGPAGYLQRLAQESAERANWKIQLTGAHTPQLPTSETNSTSEPTNLDNAPAPLEETVTDSSSEAMDLDSGIMESPNTLDTTYSSNTLTASLQLADANPSIPIEIVDLDYIAIEALRSDFSQELQITVSRMVMRDLLETYIFPLAPTVLSSGKIFQLNGQDTAQLSRTLTEQSSVAIAQGPSSLLIMYPSHFILEERVFLKRDGTPIEPNCHICLQVRALGSNFPTPPPIATTSNGLAKTLERYFQKTHGWEPSKFFIWRSGSTIQKNVFLMTHPQSHKAETEILTRYFREIGAKVWTTATKGSWDDFLKLSDSKLKGSGVVVLHPDFVQYEGIPNIRKILLGSYNIFQIRVGMKAGVPEKLNMKRILANGTCTLLVDEMYTKHPQESLELLELIVKKNDGRKKKDRTWGVYGPPQLAAWLLNLYFAKEKEEEDMEKLQLRMELYDKVFQLEDDPDEAGPGAPLLSSDISIDENELANPIPDGQTAFDAYRTENPIGAARKLLEAFAATSLQWTEQYRRLVVIVPHRKYSDTGLRKVYDEWETSSKAQHISFWTAETFMKCFREK
ncbi:hypothetical protein FKW77_007256 [Venturia effusa]|uniref:Chromo domain-containing protein n=1 Tax=Venturia effusa TaxID=50376 RepID=A0A517LB50_9PEZI|nr:hypothetical protein FKW77_007256 [Venturia effusa]